MARTVSPGRRAKLAYEWRRSWRDGDFRRLMEAVQREAVRVSVVSTLRSSPPVVADELPRQADAFIELQDLAPQIAPVSRQTEYRIPKPARPDFDATHLN